LSFITWCIADGKPWDESTRKFLHLGSENPHCPCTYCKNIVIISFDRVTFISDIVNKTMIVFACVALSFDGTASYGPHLIIHAFSTLAINNDDCESWRHHNGGPAVLNCDKCKKENITGQEFQFTWRIDAERAGWEKAKKYSDD
jgi:hypothetical protein